MVTASHERKMDDFKSAVHALPTELVLKGLASLYADRLLGIKISEALAVEPNRSQIHTLASKLYPEFSTRLNFDFDSMQVFMYMTHGLETADERLERGAERLLTNTALLGTMMQNPKRDFARLRPAIEQWWFESGDGLRTLLTTPFD
jgi:hypothetical protein